MPSLAYFSSMGELLGTPSDVLTDVLSIGRSDISTIFVSMSAKDPDGRDAEYLAWHALDHRPEQYRIPGLRASLRLVSTPACREVRAANTERYETVDHVMTYFFADAGALTPFAGLGSALGAAGRMPRMLPAVERAVYEARGAAASPRIKAGSDVLPWWPATGAYLLVERGSEGASGLTETEGVAGAWWAEGIEGLQLTFCFLDDDPVAAAHRLRPALDKRWASGAVVALLAAPFHIPVDHDWDRYLP